MSEFRGDHIKTAPNARTSIAVNERLVMASLRTGYFTFHAFGRDREEVELTLINGLEVHGEQAGIPLDWWEDWRDDVELRLVQVGKAYRDGEAIL